MAQKTEDKKTRRKIVETLKTTGPSDAKTLAAELGLTPMAVRLHLYALEEETLVTFQNISKGRGRPTKMWELTAQADLFFPSGHSDLLLDLLDSVSDTFGEDAVNKLAFARGEKQLVKYLEEIGDASRLKTKLDRLAAARTSEGYMAVVEKNEDGYLFIENHCPICSAAARCSGLCASELDVFRRALGDEYEIERTDHILAGARRCAYQVKKAI